MCFMLHLYDGLGRKNSQTKKQILIHAFLKMLHAHQHQHNLQLHSAFIQLAILKGIKNAKGFPPPGWSSLTAVNPRSFLRKYLL